MSVLLYSRKRWGVCKCGHYDWQHSDSIQHKMDEGTWIRGEGHGECMALDCGCQQFTWVGFKDEQAMKAKLKTLVRCLNCGHLWYSSNKRKYIICPKCKHYKVKRAET